MFTDKKHEFSNLEGVSQNLGACGFNPCVSVFICG